MSINSADYKVQTTADHKSFVISAAQEFT